MIETSRIEASRQLTNGSFLLVIRARPEQRISIISENMPYTGIYHKVLSIWPNLSEIYSNRYRWWDPDCPGRGRVRIYSSELSLDLTLECVSALKTVAT